VRRACAGPVTVVLLAAAALAQADGLCQGNTPRAVAARAALAAARESLPARFELADALAEANCFHDAVHTLEDGRALHPRSAELTAKLRTMRSLVSEQAYFEGKEQAELAAKRSRNLLRCTRLADLDACDEALRLKPDDAQALLAKGDALLAAARPGEADSAYRRARQLAPGDARIGMQLAAAAAQRQPLLERCRQGSDEPALRACETALSRGAEDEGAVTARMATIRQQRAQLARAAAAAPAPAAAAAPPAAAPAAAPLIAAARTYTNAAEPGRSH
jgi:hypothetical protein